MKQSKRMSLIETCINTGAGFGISLAAQWYFLPLLGVSISLHQNFVFATIMTVISICRGFILRRIFEALHIRVPMSASILAIAAERRRQIDVEGWTAEHDSNHARGALALAGACYALSAASRRFRDAGADRLANNIKASADCLWPWEKGWWKPQDNRRDLVRAGALIAAELDKMDAARKHKAAL